MEPVPDPIGVVVDNRSRRKQKREAYWRRNLGITLMLLGVWFFVTFVGAFFSSSLSAVTFFGWPLSFYMAAQGALIIYVLIVWYYARAMKKLDDEFGVDDSEEE